MKPSTGPAANPQEIELKLALPDTNTADLVRRVARLAVLARRTPIRKNLHNVYFDTPAQTLRQQRVALRIRRVGSVAQPVWLQTLKTGGRGDSALSQRGEWEVEVPDATLSREALQNTPWVSLDPDGRVFDALAPAFVTTFERTTWLVRRRNGSVIEVALDLGHILAGDRSAPICELELELRAGTPQALLDLAQDIARSIAVLPLRASKAERAYALAQNLHDAACRAVPPQLTKAMRLPEAAACVLREMFGQFITNLHTLCSSDDPEVVHQARVGWRRFRSGLRLFKTVLHANPPPARQALVPLLDALGALRDLDVARTETLAPLATGYADGDTQRAAAWDAMLQRLEQAGAQQREVVRGLLKTPAIGAALLAHTRWLETVSASDPSGRSESHATLSLQRWSRQRLDRLQHQLRVAREHAKAARSGAEWPELLHRVRIQAKRLRYGVEALGNFLPARRARQWHQDASELQQRLGASRDLAQAGKLLAPLGADRGVVDYLRGLALGRARKA